MGLYYKTLQIHNLQDIDKSHSKLASSANKRISLLQSPYVMIYGTGSRACIFSRVPPFYEWAVSNLDS